MVLTKMEQVVAESAAQATNHASGKLRHNCIPVTGRQCPLREDVPRSRDQVSPSLRKTLNELVTGKRPWPLYLWGPTGTGKTCAALCLIDQVPYSIYVTAEGLIDDAYNRGASIWQAASDSLLVVIDELGMRKWDSDREYVAVKRMADIREYKPVVWISNLSAEALRKAYDDRIWSRICCGTVVLLGGKDRRFEQGDSA